MQVCCPWCLLPVHRKGGRPTIGGRAMTSAERKRRSRERQRAEREGRAVGGVVWEEELALWLRHEDRHELD
jgi:hypothetical protein